MMTVHVRGLTFEPPLLRHIKSRLSLMLEKLQTTNILANGETIPTAVVLERATDIS